jgi:hypothetical protein
MRQPTKIVHVNAWEDFRTLAISLHPEFMAYTVQKAPLSTPPLGLRLVFTANGVQYVFLDFAEGSIFRRTKLAVHIRGSLGGDAYFDEEELKRFIRTELKREDISIVSFEVLGY